MADGGAPEPGGDLVGPGRDRLPDDEVEGVAEVGVEGVAEVEGVAGLHRTAVLLTEDADRALDLVARVLRPHLGRAGDRADSQAGPPDQVRSLDVLRTRLVRAYLQQARRRPDGAARERRTGADAGRERHTWADAGRERRTGADTDPYEVLRALRPRARAAVVLRVAHGWDLESTGAAVRLGPRRLADAVPDVPGLAEALDAVGDRHRLSGTEVLTAVAGRGAPEVTVLHGWRGWVLVGGAAIALLTVGAVLSRPDADIATSPDTGSGVAGPDGPADLADADGPGGVGGGGDSDGLGSTRGLDGLDLTPYGWHLDETGEPPVVAMGLQRQVVVEVSYGDPVLELDWDAGHLLPGGPAAYAVLWCDLPPVDPNIEQPSARLVTDLGVVDLPCAGRADGPPVLRVTPVPVTGPGRLELVGDLPRAGVATLALYREGALSATLPLPGPSAGAPPPVPTDAAVVDTPLPPQDEDEDQDRRTRLIGSVEISSETDVRVWAGQTGSVSVLADGVAVTDDGDLGGAGGGDSGDGSRGAAEAPGWREQQVDLRDGRWVVYLPGTTRTFPVPEQLRPRPGQTRTVTVEVVIDGVGDDVQVVLTHAAGLLGG